MLYYFHRQGKYLPGCRYTDWKSAFLGTSGPVSAPGARFLGPWPFADAETRVGEGRLLAKGLWRGTGEAAPRPFSRYGR